MEAYISTHLLRHGGGQVDRHGRAQPLGRGRCMGGWSIERGGVVSQSIDWPIHSDGCIAPPGSSAPLGGRLADEADDDEAMTRGLLGLLCGYEGVRLVEIDRFSPWLVDGFIGSINRSIDRIDLKEAGL